MRAEQLMRRALAQAQRAAGETSPNPLVGAVIATPDGDLIASAYHERAGAPHAEVIALEKAGAEARGATMYVTLEPCAHHGRTPPCVDALLAAGIARVVIAVLDADPTVEGGGAQRLRLAGVQVDVGLCGDAALHANRMYFHQRRTGRPFVTLKMAESIDGAVAEDTQTRMQLTSGAAQRYVRGLRIVHDAVMVGVQTAIVDDPMLTVRPFRKRAVPYTRVIVDSAARLPLGSKLVADQSRSNTIVAVSSRADQERVQALSAAGVEVVECAGTGDGRVDLHDLLSRLGRRGMLGVLCEGGPVLAGSLLRARLVNELHMLVAPLILGTANVASVFCGFDGTVATRVEHVESLGDDVLIVASALHDASTS